LKNADIRYEKLEARLLDYTGKQVIARQAIAQQSLLEIEWQEGELIVGIPKSLEREGDELVLVVIQNNEQYPSPPGEPSLKEPSSLKEPLRIPLAKISLLRRTKNSIFEI
jgi:hypothetical protein